MLICRADLIFTLRSSHPPVGNINQLVLKLSTYTAELHRHGGVIGEFVNPKYADSTKTAFKSSTRLECMMQVGVCGGVERGWGRGGVGVIWVPAVVCRLPTPWALSSSQLECMMQIR